MCEGKRLKPFLTRVAPTTGLKPDVNEKRALEIINLFQYGSFPDSYRRCCIRSQIVNPEVSRLDIAIPNRLRLNSVCRILFRCGFRRRRFRSSRWNRE